MCYTIDTSINAFILGSLVSIYLFKKNFPNEFELLSKFVKSEIRAKSESNFQINNATES